MFSSLNPVKFNAITFLEINLERNTHDTKEIERD